MNPFDHMIKILRRWTVTAEMGYIGNDTMTEVKPLMLPNGEWDRLALDDYEDFVVTLLGVFDRAGFEIIEEHVSPKMHYYFDLVHKDQQDKKKEKYVLCIRNKARSLSEVTSNATHIKLSSRKWELNRLIVNKDIYYSYNEALEDLEERLQKI